MAYQEIIVASAVKAGIPDSDSRGRVWDTGDGDQGLKFLNDGKTILIVENATTLTEENNATWDSGLKEDGDYSVELEKAAGAGDSSLYFQFDPTKKITFGEFCTNIVAGAPTEYSFYHVCSTGGVGNYAQWEFRFQDPVSFRMGADHGWIEVTLFPLQGFDGVGAAYDQIIINGDAICIYGGRTPDGTGADDFASKPLSDLAANVVIEWDAEELNTGAGVANYVMERVRFELWEQLPQPRQCNIDTVVLDGDDYPVEPGMAGAKLGPSDPEVTLTFVTYRDGYGRLETLTPTVGAKQTLIVGPLLPALFNDSDGYTKFEPGIDTALNVRYSAIRVGNPT